VISRRRFLRNTLVGSALLGGAVIFGRHLGGYHLAPGVAARLRALTPKELLVFAAAARRILAPDAPDAPSPDELEVALFVDGYLARLDEALRGDVRALLHLFEHTASVTTRFTQLSAAAQDRVLAGWQSSRLAVRRQGLQALRTLAFFGYYRDARTWPMLGYTGPMLPRRGG
jgi:hypothetical protein